MLVPVSGIIQVGEQAHGEEHREEDEAHVAEPVGAKALPGTAGGACVEWNVHRQSKNFTRGSTHR